MVSSPSEESAPGSPPPPGPPARSPDGGEPFFDLLGETLGFLDRGARGQFLSRFFKSFASVDVPEAESAALWDRILARQRELGEGRAGGVCVEAALVDVLRNLNLVHAPIVVEYRELRALRLSAGTDALTGLYNRRLFEDYFDKEVSRAKRAAGALGLVILDLRRFKEVNDRHGHQRGDDALRLVASAARETLRSSDFAFRIGGDEFAVLLPTCDWDRCSSLCRRMKARYEMLVRDLRLDLPLTLDYGISVLPDDGDDRETLFRTADRRLYEMKSPARSPAWRAPAETVNGVAHRMEKRKWERVSLLGTSAHIDWNGKGPISVAVADISFGGVALVVDDADLFPSEFVAVLHLPIQVPVKVSLRKSYARTAGGKVTRLGCAFVNGPPQVV